MSQVPGMLGMDPALVLDLARQLDAKAEEIETIVTTLTAQLGHTPWQGTDATRFRDEWSGTHVNQLRTVAQALRTTAGTARTNVTEQQNASA